MKLTVLARCLGLLVLASNPAWATDTLRLCHEDNEAYPWILDKQPGLYGTLAKLAEPRLSMHIVVSRLPWKRCLASVGNGSQDGVLGAGYLPERCAIGVYPGKSGCEPNADLRLYIDRFALYRHLEAKLSWDGKRLLGNSRPVAVQPGFVAARLLKDIGVATDETEKDPAQMLRKISVNMNEAAVIQTAIADRLLRETPGLAIYVERMTPVFVEYPAYLMLSHQFVSANPGRAQRVWQAFVETRDSNAYQASKAALGFNEAD
ncbi:hypothetical protein [Chitinimonas sp.]|uniref:hypothetical protein n=1 Tax=Chitinimonas sp. TaxID=1934313 RepID=UPI0035B1D506